MNTNDIEEQVCRLAESLKGDETLRKFPLQFGHHPQLRKLVDLFGHGCKCKKPSSSPVEAERLCRYPNCSQGKWLAHHVFTCVKRDCTMCKSMLRLVKFHARVCTHSNCIVPRCREIKERYLKKKERQRRRAKRRLRSKAWGCCSCRNQTHRQINSNNTQIHSFFTRKI